MDQIIKIKSPVNRFFFGFKPFEGEKKFNESLFELIKNEESEQRSNESWVWFFPLKLIDDYNIEGKKQPRTQKKIYFFNEFQRLGQIDRNGEDSERPRARARRAHAVKQKIV